MPEVLSCRVRRAPPLLTLIAAPACLAAAVVALPSPAWPQAGWQPPRLELARLSPLAGAAPLHPTVLDEGLPKMATQDFRGLGAEAGRVRAWAQGKPRVALRETAGSWSLADDSGALLPLSPGLGAALKHLNEYFQMIPATMARPVTHDELKAALLSPKGVQDIMALFDRSITERIPIGRGIVVPELGGEATMTAGVDFHEIPEPSRPVMRLIARNAQDPLALAGIQDKYPEDFKAIDQNGLLSRLLKNLPALEQKGVPQKERQRVLALTVDTVLENGGDTYVFDPQTQFAAIVDQNWSGRYVGKWHTHPPDAGRTAWESSVGPSPADMDIAVKDGQNLVLAFQTDGFDVYDLSPLENAQPDLSKVLKFTYRSEAWRRYFQELHDRVFTRQPGS